MGRRFPRNIRGRKSPRFWRKHRGEKLKPLLREDTDGDDRSTSTSCSVAERS